MKCYWPGCPTVSLPVSPLCRAHHSRVQPGIPLEELFKMSRAASYIKLDLWFAKNNISALPSSISRVEEDKTITKQGAFMAKITIHLEGTPAAMSKQLDEYKKMLAGSENVAGSSKKSRKAKDEDEEEVEEPELDEEEEEVEEDEAEEDEEAEEEESEEEEEESEEEEEESDGPSQEDVADALQKFSKKSKANKDKAVKILKKYLPKGKNHLDDLPEKHYAKVLKELK